MPTPCYDPVRMRRICTLFLFAALAASAQVRVLTHATLIDGTGAAPVEDATIVVRGEKIAAIGPSSKVKTPKGAQVVDLSGKLFECLTAAELAHSSLILGSRYA